MVYIELGKSRFLYKISKRYKIFESEKKNIQISRNAYYLPYKKKLQSKSSDPKYVHTYIRINERCRGGYTHSYTPCT